MKAPSNLIEKLTNSAQTLDICKMYGREEYFLQMVAQQKRHLVKIYQMHSGNNINDTIIDHVAQLKVFAYPTATISLSPRN